MVSEEDDIRESLRILLMTSPGERTMQPSYGCGIKSMIFEKMTESALTEMKDLIERAVLFFEPRITLNRIDLSDGLGNGAAAGRDRLEGVINLQLDYTVRATNTRSNMVYPFYFLEGTHIRQADRAVMVMQGDDTE